LPIEVHRSTITSNVKEESETELAHALQLRRGQQVTLAIDSGTVVHRYFYVCLACAGFVPVLVYAVPDNEMGEDARLTAENITASLKELIEKLRGFDVTVPPAVTTPPICRPHSGPCSKMA
jgi:hypothetical protein